MSDKSPQNSRSTGVASDLPASQRVERDPETLALIGDFLDEASEGLDKADDVLLAAEAGTADAEAVNALFRVFHSIKGVAGFLELTDIQTLAHNTETLLNAVREGDMTLEGQVLDAVFDATAAMRRSLDAVRAAVTAESAIAPDPDLRPLLKRIERLLGKGDPEAAAGAGGGDEGAQVQKAGAASGKAQLRETLKVDLERVDSMVEMIGELIIVESMVVHAPEIAGLSSMKVRNYLGQLTKISRDLQDAAMRMRMVPVRGVFQKMARMVRELSRKTGKKVVLAMNGEGTEMDRSMVERIEEPLVHMIRNACDHAIESSEERLAAGKSDTGTIRLSAYHEGGSILVELADDGRGLVREKILKKAIAQGLVREGDPLSDPEVWGLIFAPGFSTAAQVTEISGRGVGMDVVKRNIEAMRGRVMIHSVPGQGTSFKLVLPLTLAIIDGMLVAVGEERYIIPSLSIVESLQPTAEMLKTMTGSDELVNVRGEILPLFRLSRLFGVEGAHADATRGLVVVVESMGQKIALLVDDVLTQQQVVIKPLESGLERNEHFSGAAILSDGRVGLILNVDRLCALVGRRGFGGSGREAA